MSKELITVEASEFRIRKAHAAIDDKFHYALNLLVVDVIYAHVVSILMFLNCHPAY